MSFYYLLLGASGINALLAVWFSLIQDARRFFLCLALALTLAMLSEMQYRFLYSD
jgi:hypothetical protein